MPSIVSEAAQAVADSIAAPPEAPSARWRWGTVTAVNADGTVDVGVAGTTLSGVHAAQHVMGVAIGDRARLAYLGTESIVDAVLAPAAGAGNVVEFETVSSSTQSISANAIVEFTASIPAKTGYTCRGAVQVWTDGTGTTIVGSPWRTAANDTIHAKAHAHASASIKVYWLLMYTFDLGGWGGGGGGAGITDYTLLQNKPQIAGTTLNGNKTLAELGIAPTASPALTGTPTAPTATAGTSTTQVATTEFVAEAVQAASSGVTGVKGGAESTYRTGNVSLSASNVGAAPTAHATTATTYGKGTNANYGHVKLSDATDSTSAAASGGIAATPKAVKDALDAAYAYTQAKRVTYTFSKSAVSADKLEFKAVPSTGTSQTLTWTGANIATVLGSTPVGRATADGAGNKIATTYAPLASPALTGTPTAPTQAAGTSDTSIATTAFVSGAVSDAVAATEWTEIMNTSSGLVRWKERMGVVYVQVQVDSYAGISSGSPRAFGSIPAGYRPDHDIRTAATTDGAVAGDATMLINTAGNIVCSATGTTQKFYATASYPIV